MVRPDKPAASRNGLPAMKRLVHAVLPRSVVNFAWNLGADVSELPQRVRDPRPRPWRVVHNVGGGDFYAAGAAFFTLFKEAADLAPDACVLDIGCGAGRMTFPICAYLGEGGRYVGFDIAPRALAFARTHVRAACKVELIHADLANAEYARRGERAEAYRFPVEDGGVDAALAASLFSHIRPGVARRYLSETARALRSGGRFMLTAFLVTGEDLSRLDQARLPLYRFEDDAFAADPRRPERAVAFDEAAFLAWAEASGLRLRGAIRRGDWRAPAATGGEFQDRLVLEKV